MSASEVAPNPFWYAKSTAALSSRDRLSICVLAMFAHKSANRLNMVGIGEPVKPSACFCPAAVQSETGKVRNRRILVVAARSGECLLTIRLQTSHQLAPDHTQARDVRPRARRARLKVMGQRS